MKRVASFDELQHGEAVVRIKGGEHTVLLFIGVLDKMGVFLDGGNRNSAISLHEGHLQREIVLSGEFDPKLVRQVMIDQLNHEIESIKTYFL